MLLRTKDEFYKIFDISKSENETISASKIQNWWRKISTGNSELTKRKNAVSKIEAWWIGTNTKRKINNALKSGKYNLYLKIKPLSFGPLIYKNIIQKFECCQKLKTAFTFLVLFSNNFDQKSKSSFLVPSYIFSIGIWKWIQRFWS